MSTGLSRRFIRPWSVRAAAATLGLFAISTASAFEAPRAKKPPLLRNGFAAPELEVAPALVSHDVGRLAAEPRGFERAGLAGLERFVARASSQWEVRWDERGDRPHLIQGVGYPLLPGAGNGLSPVEIGLSDGADLDMGSVERLLRRFMREYPELLRVAQDSLQLDSARSSRLGGGRVWFVEFQQLHQGVPVEGANVFFRINNGNVVQFGADRIGEVRIAAVPRLSRQAGFKSLLRTIGLRRSEVSETLDAGTLKVHPTLGAGEAPATGFRGVRGQGYQHLLTWEYVFRQKGEAATFKAVVDARSGRLLHLVDLNYYTNATVQGGIYPRTNTDAEQLQPLPFASVTNNGGKTTSSSGTYDYTGGTASSSLNGRYIRINDNCGAISLSDSTDGNLNFGSSAGTDCSTPGSGGAGNTHAARSGFFHLTNINRKAAGFLSGNAWLDGTLTANMNINATCNAFWDGSSVNFYRSGGGCSNTGEIAAVFLHEWGHGMDTNSGGAASDKGTGEAVGDTFAFLETRDSCIGPNFQPGVPCSNCTTCTGVRDVAMFAQGGPRTIAKPSTVASDTGINCDRYACPYYQFVFFGPYQGPMGYEGHCESYIASSANWDLAQSLVATHGEEAGWAAMDQIWYESLTPSKSAYQVVSGGKCNPSAVVNGCGASNWYTVFLSADDDDGNLANGTPNGCRIWDAFTAHGIACGSRPACSGGCTPQAVADAGPDQSIASGQSVTIGTPALAGHSYLWSPGGETTAQILVSPGATTTYTVTATTSCGSANDSVTVNVSTPGAELIVNGGFEGSLAPWVRSGRGALYTANGTQARSGTGYIYFQGNNASGRTYQQVSIPGGATASLTFWLNVTSNETTTTAQNDKLFVEVRSTADALLATLGNFSNLDKSTAYSQKAFSLAAFGGQTVRVQFRVANNGSRSTVFRVDDASLQ